MRRRLPQRHAAEPLVRDLPIRVLLVSPRPEDERAGYIDHRASARPLVEALEPLGELVKLTLLSPPTFPAMVETARRFVDAFYQRLAEGHRVGQAMLAGQRRLQGDPTRGRIMGAGQLELHDWFVPVLYQEAADPALSPGRPGEDVQYLQNRQRRLSLGRLPDPPRHTFVGRSREMLALERLLDKGPYAVICGPGGSGKTTLAVELARWMFRTGRCRRVAFLQLDACADLRGLVDSLGQQLLPAGELLRAIECRRPYGHAAELWKTWDILCDLERACGNLDAARGARQKAIEAFRAFRRAGGENHWPGGRLCRDIGEAIRSHQLDAARARLAGLRNHPQATPAFQLLISKLEAVLAGSREGVLAADPDLDFADAVELELLLEGLAGAKAGE